MGIEGRLKRLEAANPKLCEARPCKGPITMSQERLLEDGTVEITHYEGGSEEAERIRQEAQQRGPAS